MTGLLQTLGRGHRQSDVMTNAQDLFVREQVDAVVAAETYRDLILERGGLGDIYDSPRTNQGLCQSFAGHGVNPIR